MAQAALEFEGLSDDFTLMDENQSLIINWLGEDEDICYVEKDTEHLVREVSS